MALHDRERQRQAQAGALAHVLGGEEGLEDAAHHLVGHARAGVVDLHPHPVVLQPRRQRDDAAALDRMRRIDDQVHEHLVQLAGQALHRRQGLQGLDHLGLVLDLVQHHVQGRFQAGVQVGLLPVGLVHAREILQVLHDLLHPGQAFGALVQQLRQVFLQVGQLHLVDQAAGMLHGGRITGVGHRGGLGIGQAQQRLHVLAQGVEVGADEAHRVVDLMGHAGRQLADGGHLVVLQQLVLGLGQLLVGGLQLLEALTQGLLRGAHLGAVLHHPPGAGVAVAVVHHVGVDLHPDRPAAGMLHPHLMVQLLALREQRCTYLVQLGPVGRLQVEVFRAIGGPLGAAEDLLHLPVAAQHDIVLHVSHADGCVVDEGVHHLGMGGQFGRPRLDHLVELALQLGLGAPALADVLQGDDGTDGQTVVVAQRRGGEAQPAAFSPHLREEGLGVVGADDQLGRRGRAAITLGHVVRRHAVDDQVGQQRPGLGVEGLPGLVAADHLVGAMAGQAGAGGVPVGDAVVAVDHERRHRRAIDDLLQQVAHALQHGLHMQEVTVVDAGDQRRRVAAPGQATQHQFDRPVAAVGGFQPHRQGRRLAAAVQAFVGQPLQHIAVVRHHQAGVGDAAAVERPAAQAQQRSIGAHRMPGAVQPGRQGDGVEHALDRCGGNALVFRRFGCRGGGGRQPGGGHVGHAGGSLVCWIGPVGACAVVRPAPRARRALPSGSTGAPRAWSA